MGTLAGATGSLQPQRPEAAPALFDSHQEAAEAAEDARVVERSDRPEPPTRRRAPSLRRRALRTGLEELGALGAGSVWYLGNLDFNKPDWVLQWNAHDWWRKVTLDAVRFDDNLFDTNILSHGKAGTAYYTLARGNRLSLPQSLLTAFATSVAWEYLVEFQEMPSVNDMVITPMAGMAFGESLFQLGEFFRRGRRSWLNTGLATLFSPATAAHDWLDGREDGGGDDALDGLGLSRTVWHRFALSAGVSSAGAGDDHAATELSLGTELVTLPGYRKPGAFARPVRPGTWTGLVASASVRQEELIASKLSSRVALGGTYRQSIERDASGRLRGWGLFVGGGSAFDYETRELPGLGNDMLGIARLAGPMAELTLARGPLRLRATADAYLDFALVRSTALGSYLALSGPTGIRSVLAERGYYFAYGLSTSARLVAELYGADLGAEARLDTFGSIQGLDPHQETLTHDFALADARGETRVWAGYRPGDGPVRVSVALDRLHRSGAIGDLLSQADESRLSASASVVF